MILDIFNQLDIASKVFLGFIVLVIILAITNNICGYLLATIRKICTLSRSKYKKYSENKFNQLLLEHLTKKIKNTNKFVVECFFVKKEENDLNEIIINFAQAFSRYFNVKTSFNENSISLIFENFTNTVNGVIDQLYIIKKSREKQYENLKIYISIVELEDETKLAQQLSNLKRINTLKLDKNIICTSSFKFYYQTLTFNKYQISSKGYYMLNNAQELFTVEMPARTL